MRGSLNYFGRGLQHDGLPFSTTDAHSVETGACKQHDQNLSDWEEHHDSIPSTKVHGASYWMTVVHKETSVQVPGLSMWLGVDRFLEMFGI